MKAMSSLVLVALGGLAAHAAPLVTGGTTPSRPGPVTQKRRIALDMRKIELTCKEDPNGYGGGTISNVRLVDESGALDRMTQVKGHTPYHFDLGLPGRASQVCNLVDEAKRRGERAGKRLEIQVEVAVNTFGGMGTQPKMRFENLLVTLSTGLQLHSSQQLP